LVKAPGKRMTSQRGRTVAAVPETKALDDAAKA
jgi:hypothetical protein